MNFWVRWALLLGVVALMFLVVVGFLALIQWAVGVVGGPVVAAIVTVIGILAFTAWVAWLTK